MTAAIDQHATCQHKVYFLSCEDFEALLERSLSRCELCGRPDVRLWIDHDHDAAGDNRVRGLLCAECNSHMRFVDRGTRPSTPAIESYLEGALDHAGPANSRRTFCCDAELWNEARRIAKRRGESLSEVLRDALRRYVRRNRGAS